MQTMLLVAELVIAIALIGFVLLQRSEGGGLGMGGGSSSMGGLFTARGAADTLTRTTSILAFLFFLTCILLNILALNGRDQSSILDSVPAANIPAKPQPAPITPPVMKINRAMGGQHVEKTWFTQALNRNYFPLLTDPRKTQNY